MPSDPIQPVPPTDDSSEPEHHFAPDIPIPPPPPRVPDLLTKPVERRKAEPDPDPAGVGDTARAWGTAMDFVFTVIAATGLGYAIGKWLGSVLTGLLIGLSLGFALGMTKLFRAVGRANRS